MDYVRTTLFDFSAAISIEKKSIGIGKHFQIRHIFGNSLGMLGKFLEINKIAEKT